jgi:hypothetical protein
MKAKYLIAALLFLWVANVQAQEKVKIKKSLLQGSWFGKESDDAAVFSIYGDTITYIDDFSKFKYTITKDTFELKTTQPHYKMLFLKLTQDSLIFKELPSMEIDRYWKS